MEAAGFRDVHVVQKSRFEIPETEIDAYARSIAGNFNVPPEAVREAARSIPSGQVFGRKPAPTPNARFGRRRCGTSASSDVEHDDGAPSVGGPLHRETVQGHRLDVREEGVLLWVDRFPPPLGAEAIPRPGLLSIRRSRTRRRSLPASLW